MNGSSRRRFIKNLTGSAAAMAVGSGALAQAHEDRYFEALQRKRISINDNLNIGLIGAGGMGTQDTITALKVPGIKLLAVCDLYDGRLKDAKTKWGADIFTTRS